MGVPTTVIIDDPDCLLSPSLFTLRLCVPIMGSDSCHKLT
jgi:hypothetical protein